MIQILLVLIVIGLILYLVERFIPMSEPIKIIIRVLVVILIILYLVQAFGLSDLPAPRLR